MSTLILTVIMAVILGIILILTTIITLITIVFTIAWNPLCHHYFRRKRPNKSSSFTIAFFHPYCDTGGGGERVLWCGINGLKKQFPNAQFVVYTGDLHVTGEQILDKAQKRFQIQDMQWMKDPDKGIKFIYLKKRVWVEAKTYPRFTLLGQSLGSICLAWEALMNCCPDVFIDTTGYAFTLPVFKNIGKCNVACYVHYPTISSDMLRLVRNRSSTYNNTSEISKSWLLSSVKLQYYKIFAFLYKTAGNYSDVTMVNSSWTEGHISDLWNLRQNNVYKVFPPCDNTEFLKIQRQFQDNYNTEQINVISVGQFRPEKDHALQIRAISKLRGMISEQEWKRVRLILVGGSRNSEDDYRIKELQNLCQDLSVDGNVDFKVNIPFSELLHQMAECLIGLHTMWNEHFGIAVVEMLAAGLITIAHRSGGPQMDIVTEADDLLPKTGFLATKDVEYANCIKEVMRMSCVERAKIIENARKSVTRFSEREFEINWNKAVSQIVHVEK